MVEVALWNSPLMIGRDHLEGSALSSFSPQEKQLWLLTRKFLVTDLMITQKVAKVPLAQKDWRMTIPILSVGRFCFWRFWQILTHSRIFLPEDAFPLSLFYNSASFSFPISWLPDTKEIKGMYLSYFNGNSFFESWAFFPFWADTHMMRYTTKFQKACEGTTWGSHFGKLGLVAYSTLKL